MDNRSLYNSNNSNSNYTYQNYIDKIKNYFIDDNIIIKDNDENNIKIKKFLLKYKRIIGLIFLIILLIIGYHCNPYNTIYNNSNSNSKIIQKGGGGEGEAPPPVEAPTTDVKTDTANVKTAAADVKTAAADGKIPGLPGDGKTPGKPGTGDKKPSKLNKAKKTVGKGLKTVGKGIKGAPSAMFNAGAAAANKFKDNADVIYQIFYSIALFILLAIVTIPSIAFIVIGLICYILLKDKLKFVKSL